MPDVWNPVPLPTVGTTKSVELPTYSAKMGDGYEATAPKGPKGVQWADVTVQLLFDPVTHDDADELEAFLREQYGSRRFYYTLPSEVTARAWRARKWTRTSRTQLTDALSVELVEVPDL